jgi:hypothetical protein
MRRSDAYKIYPQFKALFKDLRCAKGKESDEAWHILGEALDREYQENKEILEKATTLQNDHKVIFQSYKRHLKRMPRSSRIDVWVKWHQTQAELETKLSDVMLVIKNLYSESKINARTEALAEIGAYYVQLTRGL